MWCGDTCEIRHIPESQIFIEEVLFMSKSLNKRSTIDAMVKKTGLKRKDATTALDGFLDVVRDALAKHDAVRLVGFGNFTVNHHKSRMGRNPQTGAPLKIAARDVPAFKAGVPLKKLVNK